MAARVDVTALLKQAAASLPAGEWLAQPGYTLQDSMGAVELMEPKLDSGARRDAPLVPVSELVASGTVPVASLTPETTVHAMDALLSLEASWMRGNSLPQTVLTCLYTRPAAIAALAQAAGIELPVASSAAAVHPPAAGSAAAACAAALLGFVVATLVTVDAGGRAVLAADMSEEEDTVLFPDHYRPVAEGFKAALGTHDHAATVPLASEYPRRALALLQHAEAVVSGWLSSSSGGGSDAFAPVQSRLALRRGLLSLHAVMAPGAQAPAPEPLHYGRVYDAPAACDAVDVAFAALCDITAAPTSALPKEGDAAAAAAAINAAPGVVSAYQREVLKGTSPRFVPLQGWATTLAWWRAHLQDAHALLQAYAAASYNPHRPLQAKGQSQHPAVPGARVWKELCAEGSCFPRPAAAQADPAALTAYLAAAGSTGAAAAPLPRLPLSGLTDPPLPASLHPPLPAPVPHEARAEAPKPASTWATLHEVLAADKVLGEGPASTAARGIPATRPSAPPDAAPSRRPHVSLHALFAFMEQFSRRNADVVVRAWAATLLWQPGPGSLPGAAPAAGGEPYSDFAWAEGTSAAVLGSHTLMELVRGSCLDVGVPPELLVTIDFQKFSCLCEVVWKHTLRVLVGTRLRIRRRIDTVLAEWAIVLQDCDLLDGSFASYLARRCGDAAYAWARAQAGLAPPTTSAWAPVTAALMMAEGVTPEARVTELRASLASFPVADTGALWRLHALTASTSTSRLGHWAQDFAIRLQQLHLVTGWETQVYHVDETAAVWWYQDVLTAQALRVHRALAVGKATAAALPEAGALAADTVALLQRGAATGSHPGLSLDGRLSALEELARLGMPLEEPKPAAALSASGAAGAGSGGKKGGGKSGGGGKKGGGKKGGGDDDELLDMLAASGGAEAALEAARGQVTALVAHWRKELETVLAALVHQHGTALHPAADAPRWRSRAQEAMQAESQLRRAGLKMLMAARTMGLWRGLERECAPPGTPGVLPSFFRSSAAAFEARFRAFDPYDAAVGIVPRRLTFRDYRQAFLKGRYTKATTMQLLQEAVDHATAARQLAQRVLTHAKAAGSAAGSSGTGLTAASIYAAAGGGAFLGASATPAAVAAAAAKAAAGAKAGGGSGGGGGKKGGGASKAAPGAAAGQPNPHYYSGPEEHAAWTAGDVHSAPSDAAAATRIARAAVHYGLTAGKLLERPDLLPADLPEHPADPLLAKDTADEFWEVAAPAGCGLPPGARVAAPFDSRYGRPEPPRRTTALGLDLAQDAWFPPIVVMLPPRQQADAKQ